MMRKGGWPLGQESNLRLEGEQELKTNKVSGVAADVTAEGKLNVAKFMFQSKRLRRPPPNPTVSEDTGSLESLPVQIRSLLTQLALTITHRIKIQGGPMLPSGLELWKQNPSEDPVSVSRTIRVSSAQKCRNMTNEWPFLLFSCFTERVK